MTFAELVSPKYKILDLVHKKELTDSEMVSVIFDKYAKCKDTDNNRKIADEIKDNMKRIIEIIQF